jgi:threonine dehydrogenase-like Zn-dependent dehydrogenase
VVGLGVFAGLAGQFPLGALMNKGLTPRGAQQHGQRYLPMPPERMEGGELVTEPFATHVLPLEGGPRAYQLFKERQDGCLRAVLLPGDR